MFVDSVSLLVSSGKGGAGAVSFHREKFVIQGGPDGGDGGDGGDVYFITDENTDTLSNFRGKKHLKAGNGSAGSIKNRAGKRGEDLLVKVPVGTQVFDANSGALLLDLTSNNQKTLFLKGGKGGLGNARFKSATNQRPSYAQSGLPGAEQDVRLELKLIADVGLVGFANVGKSTLISVISNARPEIGDYEFTTLTPNLGVVDIDRFSSFVVADIPGLIEGASSGRGLGHKFLKHIERTKFLLFLLDVSNYRDLALQYSTLKAELQKFSQDLGQKPFAIALSKADTLQDDAFLKAFLADFAGAKPSSAVCFASDEPGKPRFILPISSASRQNIDLLKQLLAKELELGKRA
ncbi:MAG: GTPase ObgE [Helicobacteraceae bacterium]